MPNHLDRTPRQKAAEHRQPDQVGAVQVGPGDEDQRNADPQPPPPRRRRLLASAADRVATDNQPQQRRKAQGGEDFGANGRHAAPADADHQQHAGQRQQRVPRLEIEHPAEQDERGEPHDREQIGQSLRAGVLLDGGEDHLRQPGAVHHAHAFRPGEKRVLDRKRLVIENPPPVQHVAPEVGGPQRQVVEQHEEQPPHRRQHHVHRP